MDQTIIYNPFQFVTVSTPEVMKYELSLSDLSLIDKKRTKLELTKIIAKYLSVSAKVKNISEVWYELIVDHLLTNCKNLELQEIDFIFKNGIMGRLVNNYQEISIDTICGIGGWIETYYRDIRIKRLEPGTIAQYEMNGKEMTYAEFLEKNPEYKNKSLSVQSMKTKAIEWTIEVLKDRLGDKFESLYKKAEQEYETTMKNLKILREIVKKEHTKAEGAMYDVYLQAQKDGREKFIINRLRHKASKN
jgi:hypothetical protein